MHALIRTVEQFQYLVMFRWWGWAWLRACCSELIPEQYRGLPAPPSVPDWTLLSGPGDGGGWVGWLELLEPVTGSEPAGTEPESHTIPCVGNVSPRSHYNQQLGDDEQTCGYEGGSVCLCASMCVCVYICIWARVLLLTVATPRCNHM